MEIKEALQELGYQVSELANEFRAKPIYRDSSNNLSLRVSKSDGQWIDFGTGDYGNFQQLVEKTLGIGDAQKFLEDRPIRIVEVNKVGFMSYLDPIPLNKSYAYWLGRGISQSTQDLFESGIDPGWKLKGRHVFVIKDEDGRIVGFDGRATWKVSGNTPKWKKIGKKSNWVYPLISVEHCIKKKSIIIVESIGDLLSLYECGIKNVLVSFGLTVNTLLLSKIIEINPRNIFIALNNDEDTQSGQKGAVKIQDKLSRFFNKDCVKIKIPPKGDFNEILTSQGKDAILDWYVKV